MASTRNVNELLDGHQQKVGARGAWERHWQEVADYLEPRSSFTRQPSAGEQRNEKVFDTTAMQAKRGLAASLDGLIKPRTQRWVAVKPVDDDLADHDESKMWVAEVGDRMWNAIYDPRARFIQASGETDNDLVTFGTGIMFIGESNSLDGFMFQSIDLANAFIGVNHMGVVDEVDSVLRLSAKQAVLRFGVDNVGEKTREDAADTKTEKKMHKFVQRVFPNDRHDPRRAESEFMPFVSITIDVDSRHIIGESGYHEFPYVTPRWDTATGEIYGRSPAMLSLPDTKTSNQMGKTILRAGHLAADPPQIALWDGAVNNRHRVPGGVVYASPKAWELARGAPMQPLQNGFNLPISREMQMDVRDQIWNAFFRNQLQLPPAGPNMTATEVIERKEEFIRVIGPVFGRLEAEYTSPLAERVFNVMMRAGVLPKMPDALAQTGIRFDFRSPITEAQKQIEAMVAVRYAEATSPYAENPETYGVLNMPELTRGVAEGIRMPPKWLKSKDQVLQEKEEAVAAQQQQQMMEQALGAGEGIANIASKLPPELMEKAMAAQGGEEEEEDELAGTL